MRQFIRARTFFIAALVVLQAMIAFLHYFFYETAVAAFGIENPGLLLAFRIALGILAFAFFAASFVSARRNNAVTRLFYKLAAGWIGFFVYLMLAAYGYWFIVLIAITRSIVAPPFIAPSLFLAAIGTGVYGIVNACRPVVVERIVKLPDLPPVWQGRQAVFISDLHLGQVRGRKFAKKVAGKIAAAAPAALFVGGDLYDGPKIDARRAIEPLAGLKIPLGTYFVTGNHEEFSEKSRDEFLSAVRGANMRILFNEAVDIEGLRIAGVDYKTTARGGEYSEKLKNALAGARKPTVLLRHVPDHLDIAESAGVDFQICGHTHGGQIFPAMFLTNLIYKGFSYGMKNKGRMQVYVSSGAGTWGPPMRVGTKPEVVLFTFERG